jgi:hypothetical protein
MNRVFLTLASVLFLTFAATAQTTNGLSDAEIQGQSLAQEILEEAPATNFTQHGTLRIEDAKKKITDTHVIFVTRIASAYLETHYFADERTNNLIASIYLVIIHRHGQPNKYLLARDVFDLSEESKESRGLTDPKPLDDTQIMAPFAGSDFWICDLGLEFFHWPGQKVLKHETRRTRACTVLESTNPDPSPGSYSHVDSWIDDETLGVVHAEAYDAKGKLLKVFDPKSFKKVNGQWELQDMEIRNIQTGSRTWIKFDLNNKS